MFFPPLKNSPMHHEEKLFIIIQQGNSKLIKIYIGGYKFNFDSPNDYFGVDTELLSGTLFPLR